MQECEKEGGRKSLATVALILSKLLPPHTLTSSHPHLIVTFTASHPHHLVHPVNLTCTQCTSPTITPQPHTPHPSHHPPPCTPSHCKHTHEQPRYLNRSKMESTVSSCVTCPVEALLHVRSIDRVPAPWKNGHHHQHAQRHGGHCTVRARGEVAQHGLPAKRARHFGVEPTAPRALDSRPGGRSPSPRSRRTSSPCRRWLRTGSGYSFDFADSAVFVISNLGRA